MRHDVLRVDGLPEHEVLLIAGENHETGWIAEELIVRKPEDIAVMVRRGDYVAHQQDRRGTGQFRHVPECCQCLPPSASLHVPGSDDLDLAGVQPQQQRAGGIEPHRLA